MRDRWLTGIALVIVVLLALTVTFCVLWYGASDEIQLLKADLERAEREDQQNRQRRSDQPHSNLARDILQVESSSRSEVSEKRVRELEQEVKELRGRDKAVPRPLIGLMFSLILAFVFVTAILFNSRHQAAVRARELEKEQNKAREESRKQQDDARTRIQSLEDKLGQVKSQLVQAENAKLWREQLNSLNRGPRDLEEQLKSALLRLVTVESAMFDHSSTGLQHDQLQLSFRQLRDQGFRYLAEAFYRGWKEKAPDLRAGKSHIIQDFQYIFVKEILFEGSRFLLSQRESRPHPTPSLDQTDLDRARSSINDRVASEIKQYIRSDRLGDSLKQSIDRVVGETITFLQGFLNSSPPGKFLLASEGEVFRPMYHEPWDRTSPFPDARIHRTIFPGYFVYGPQYVHVAEKAQVQLECPHKKED